MTLFNLKIFSLLITYLLCWCDAIKDTTSIESLVNTMTVEEKCGQMTQLSIMYYEKHNRDETNETFDAIINEAKLIHGISKYKIGSVIATPGFVAAKASTIQQIVTKLQDATNNNTRLKIPIIYGIDSVHGGSFIHEAVLFPHSIGMAATFNTDLVYQIGQITAMETRATGIPWNFHPVLDVARQPLWSRFAETFGEDVYLVQEMGRAIVEGYQSHGLTSKDSVAACLKHFIGYSMPFNGRDRTSAYIPENLLREVFLPPFQTGIETGALTVMLNSGDVNGIPGHANSYYVNDILKKELGFKGFVVSDWSDVKNLYERDRVAETEEDAVKIAVLAGLDMSQVPLDYSFHHHCVNLSRKNQEFKSRVDDAVTRILRVKKQLGLFEDPYPNPADLSKIGTMDSEALNLEAASESIILAKNVDHFLPISSSRSILVTGPTANLIKSLCGMWSFSWAGDREASYEQPGRPRKTIFQAISEYSPSAEFIEGVNFTEETSIEQVVQVAKTKEVIVLCIGEDNYAEYEGSINSLMINEIQIKLADALFSLNKHVVVVYVGGRPRIITDIVHKAEAVLLAFYPGTRGGQAIADILFGAYNPNGRLPFTYPASVNGLVLYDHKHIDVFAHSYGYSDSALFPFGHGLSYTSFAYSDLKLSVQSLTHPYDMKVSVMVKNTGTRAGKEVVILYLNDEVSSVARPMHQMKRFQKIALNPSEARLVTFTLNLSDFMFINQKNERVFEAGYFGIYVSNLNSRFKLMASGSSPLMSSSFGFIYQLVFLILIRKLF